VDWRTTAHPDQPQEKQYSILVYMARADIPLGAAGSRINPLPLIDPGASAAVNAAGEGVYPLAARFRGNNADPRLRDARVIVDPRAGLVRFTMDTRLLFRLLTAAAGQAAPP